MAENYEIKKIARARISKEKKNIKWSTDEMNLW